MTTNDLDAVAGLVRTDTASALTWWDWKECAGVTADTLVNDLARPHSESFAAFSGADECIGYAYARIRRGSLWLDRLVVMCDAGKEGCAAALLHAVIANYIGDPAISVAVGEHDPASKAFFEGQGFVAACDEDAAIQVVLRRPISRA